MVSIKDIAIACQVSAATVSKALKTNRIYNLGVLFEEEDHSGLTHDYFVYMPGRLKSTAEERGYDITFINSRRTRPNRMSYLEHCRCRGYDGILIARHL